MLHRRAALTLLAASAVGRAAHADPTGGDPFGSLQWPDLQREFFGSAPVVFDERVVVRGPSFAEDPMNVPISVSATGLPEVETLVVFVDRNPIRKVLEYQPLAALASLGFRFKLEQASPVRAAAKTKDGIWHVGGTRVDSAGGGCTVAGATRKDGSWAQTLGQARGKVFASSPAAGGGAASRLRVMVMHPMDTGLVGGIPAFYVNRLSVRDAQGRELLRLATFEPVSENPVFSFDFPGLVAGGLRLVGSDNNGNRIDSRIE
ncbi:quinoprotein dehydrogenase-associated SoxYZ-like carrier [uncultured Piscinibacter sp.]|uniref:quinoprotein dehydrogenase-associated SoxYZ-like carrier n=1 Tax=uncultured Piscinibacter sp. TaxID=1131835 RepID=UPI002636DFEE|nr:quinoprotein dehydrogenase-associated SoxYZ-like carrier [uncultured Piscinibacter sp.]